MKKTMYLALAVLFLWGVWFSTPLTALAAEGEPTITSVELTATKTLIEDYDCHIEYDSSQNDEPFNYYYLNSTEPNIKLNFSDGTTKEFKFFDEECGYFDYFADPIWCEQGAGDKELKPGTHTKTVCMTCSYNGKLGVDEYIETAYTFTIEENPVESISVVANESLRTGIDGWFSDITDEETGDVVGRDFNYELEFADIQVTVNYKNASFATYDYSSESENNIYQKTGYALSFEYEALGEGTNTITASYMGVKTTFPLEIVENPYKSISLEATEDLIYNYSGTDCGDYFSYDLGETKPLVTVTYANGNVRTYSYSECEAQFGYYPEFKHSQSPENEFVKGENTQTVAFLGNECEYTFNIEESPVESIVVNTPALEERNSGYFFDDRYYYQLDENATTITVNYTNETKEPETETLFYMIDMYPYGFEVDLNQGENELAVGKHTGTVSYLGYETTFEFEIVSNPIKAVSVTATEKLIENESGSVDGESYSTPYFRYDIYESLPEVTVTYSDGRVETYGCFELYSLGYSYSFNTNQDPINQLKVGKNVATFTLNGVSCEFTFEIIENPIKSISLKATKDLIENQSGWYVSDSENEFFWYYISDTLPDLTVNYNDGTTKTFSYVEFTKLFDYCVDLNVDQSVEPLKVGTNKITARIGNFECEYEFNLVKPEVAITGIAVVPEGTLLEAHNGYWEWDYECEKDYFWYAPDAVTYTLTVNYSDGSSETYKNLNCNQVVDGGNFTVYYDNYSYEDRFVVGKNTAYAEFKGARATFDVEVVENTVKAIEISGNNEFILTMITEDGTKNEYTAKDLYIGGMSDEYVYDGSLMTDKGSLIISLQLKLNADKTGYTDIVAMLTSVDGETVIKSNTLSSNRWIDMIFHTFNLDEASKWLYEYNSAHFFDTEFHGLEGSVIKGSAVDKALTICTSIDYIGNYKDTGEDDKGEYAILSLEEAKKLANKYFDDDKLDIESSPLYNAAAKEIKVYFLLGCDGVGINRELKYEDGKFVLTSICQNYYTYELIPVKMVISETGYVESIYIGSHSYTSEIVKQPTATETGIREHTCSCGDSYLSDIAKLVGKVEENKDNNFSAVIEQPESESENIASKIEVTIEEQELIDTGLDLRIVLFVEELENKIDTVEKEAIVDCLGTCKLGSFIDIQLVKQIGTYEKNIEKTKSDFYVSLMLPENLINTDKSMERIYKIARYHDGDESKVAILDATFDSETNYLTFATDRFSTYAIVYEDVEKKVEETDKDDIIDTDIDKDNADTGKDEVPDTGVVSTSALWLGAMAVSGLGALALSKKKKED